MHYQKSTSYTTLASTSTAQYSHSSSQLSQRRSTHLKQQKSIGFSTLPDTSLEMLNSNLNPSRRPPAPTSLSARQKWRPLEKDSQGSQIKRYYLSKVIINRMMNIRVALLAFNDVPVTLFSKNQDYSLAKEIIFKNKLNPETSVLRTLVFADQSRAALPQKKSFTQTRNIFVLPTQVQSDKGKQKAALIQLSHLLKKHIRDCVCQFKANLQTVRCRERYFSRIGAGYERCRLEAFERMRWVPDQKRLIHARSQVEILLLKRLWNSWQQRYDHHAQEFVSSLSWYAKQVQIQQTNIVKNMTLFSGLRREQMFLRWRKLAKMPAPQPKAKTFKITEEKKQVLNRLILRSYVKLFKRVLRKKVVFKGVAGRMALNTRINEQKGLWRLLKYLQQWR